MMRKWKSKNRNGRRVNHLGRGKYDKRGSNQKSKQISELSGTGDKESLWDLASQYIPENGLAIEVGTWKGGSAVIIGEICRQKKARLLCIDAFSGNMHKFDKFDVIEFQNTTLNLEGLPVDYLIADSENAGKYLCPEIADFILVDADHHLPKVKADIELYWQCLKHGGGYLLHDYTNPCDVKEVVDNFFSKEKVRLFPDSFAFIQK